MRRDAHERDRQQCAGDSTKLQPRGTLAGEKWEALNTLSLEWGIHLYPHNHSPAYNFLQDGPMVTVTEDRLTGAPIPPTT